jgi:hypothetical protein
VHVVTIEPRKHRHLGSPESLATRPRRYKHASASVAGD